MALSSIGGKFKGVISKDQDLLDAAKHGNVEAIEKLTAKKRQSQFLPSFLKGSVNINCADREGYTPLHLASLNGHKSAVECLLQLEASVSLKDNSGCTPLHLAAWKGYDEICKLFLTFSNTTIPIDLQNSLGDTALHMAAQYGYKNVVEVLLGYKADSTIRNLKDESPLDLAAQYGRQDVVQLLVAKNPDLVKHTVTSHSPLHLAAACGHVQIIKTLVGAGYDINTMTTAGTALHTAAMYCKVDVVKILVESGIDIHAQDGEGKTALEIVLKNDQTQPKYAEIAKFIRDHIMKSDMEVDPSKMDDGNVYDTSFDVKSPTPPPAPKVEDQTKDQKESSEHATEPKPRPVPKPRLSLEDGSHEEERKSALYAKPDKDRAKNRVEETPKTVASSSTPQPKPRTSLTSSQPKSGSPETKTDDKQLNPPDLPKKERDSTPPLPPKTDDIPLLPPKVIAPTSDMVVADMPPVRSKSQELLESPPPPCEVVSSDSDNQDETINLPSQQPGGYFEMTGKKAVESDVSSPATQKKRPAKPPRKKSPAPSRKNDQSPMQVKEFEEKEDYETMSNVKKHDTSHSEDVYKTLFQSVKENSNSKNSDDTVPCDPEYTNIGSFHDYRSSHQVDSSKSVPFSKYNDKQSESMNTESHLTEDSEEIYQNVCRPSSVQSGKNDRSSHGFQQLESSDKNQSESSDLTSVIESESRTTNFKQCDSEKGEGCDSSMCDKPLQEVKNIHGRESNISDKCSKNKNSIPNQSCDDNQDIPKEPLQNGSNIPKKSVQSERNIPNTSLQSESNIPESNIPKRSSHPDNGKQSLQTESNIPSKPQAQTENIKNNVPVDTISSVSQHSSGSLKSRKSDNFVPELPPKSNRSSNVSQELASDEKRLSNGPSGDLNSESQNKKPKPDSLELAKKRTSEHKFPTTPTGYPQPPTPDFPPPSPNTALRGIEKKMAGIEVSTNKRSSRDIETLTEDLQVTDKAGEENSSGGSSQDAVTPVNAQDERTVAPGNHPVKDESESRSHDQKSLDHLDEEVVLRRSSQVSSTGSIGSGLEVLVGDELQPFAGLLRGSATGGPRKVVSQIYEHVALPHKRTGSKRSSLPLGNMTFEPVMEREEDVSHVSKSDRAPSYEKRPNKLSGTKDDTSFDDADEWDQIADIVSSFGAELTHDELVSNNDTHIDGRDEGSNTTMHSVGEWLESLGLGQYENTLYANGFDDTDFLGEKIMEEQDLESIGITTVEHRKKILDHAKKLPQIKPIRSDVPPESVEFWLNSLRLPQYLDKFITHKYDTMERVLQLWDIELNTVLDILSLGHRKRILASLGNRTPPERTFSSLKKKSREEHKETKSHFTDVNLFKDYTKVKPLTSTSEEEAGKSSKPETPSIENSDNDEVFQNNVQGKGIKDTTIHIRPPHQTNFAANIKQWRHKPEMLIKGCCNYTAQYLGSTLVKELTGTSSTIEGITKLKLKYQKSADAIAKIPTIMLSISYRGVKFIDARSKKVICDHEIVNIFCACQDAESMNFFAYITRDNQTGKHYCHVFSVKTADLAREVIMTLGEAFEVAYQMAQKERAAEEAKEFERALSQSDTEESSQSKSSSKASLNTV